MIYHYMRGPYKVIPMPHAILVKNSKNITNLLLSKDNSLITVYYVIILAIIANN